MSGKNYNMHTKR